MANIPIHNFDTVLEWGTDGVAWAELTNCVSCSTPAEARAKAKTTHLRSIGRRNTYVPSWSDTGESEAMFLLDDDGTQYETLKAAVGNGTVYYWRKKAPLVGSQSTGHTWVWNGQILEVSEEPTQVDDEVYQYTLKIAFGGTFTFTKGS